MAYKPLGIQTQNLQSINQIGGGFAVPYSAAGLVQRDPNIVGRTVDKMEKGLPLTSDEQTVADAIKASGGVTTTRHDNSSGIPVVDAIGGFAKRTGQAILGGQLPPDPAGTPGIDDGQTFKTTGLGGGLSGNGLNSFGGSSGPGTGSIPAAVAPGSTGNPSLDALIAEARRNQNENNTYIDNTLVPNLNAYRGGQLATIGAQQGQDQAYAGVMGGLFQKSLNDASAANQASLAGLQGLGAGLGAINSNNDAIYNQMANTYAGFSQLDPTHQVANLQAAQASLSLANYQTAQLFQAALERAQANPNDVQAQKDALNLAAQISQGSNDVQNGGLTPEAKAAQLSALQQYGALTSPEVTAKERFLYESQRLQQEQQEKASRDALMAEYRMRGQGGSGQELGAILQAGQQNSQQRLLGDLGTQAGAVDRSMQALAGYGGLSTQMVGQGNQVAEFNMSQRLQALGVRADIANQIAANSQQLSEFNANQANNVNVANAGFANQNAQFNASAYNQNQQFNASQKNAVSMFNTGQTNMINMNNLNQNMAQTQFEDTYRQNEQQNAAIRASNLANTGLTKNANNATNLGTLSNTWQGVVNDTFGRNTTATNVGAQAAGNIANNFRMTNNDLLGLGPQWAGQDLGVADLRARTSQGGSAAVQAALGKSAGQDEADKALAAISAGGGGGLGWNPIQWLTST